MAGFLALLPIFSLALLEIPATNVFQKNDILPSRMRYSLAVNLTPVGTKARQSIEEIRFAGYKPHRRGGSQPS
jgi:hypothetical protein